jgi:hypothetical protein
MARQQLQLCRRHQNLLNVCGSAFHLAVIGANIELIFAEKVQLRCLANISATVF